MTERHARIDGEDRQTQDLAPENENAEQSDAGEQAQTVADEARGRLASDASLNETKKVPTDDISDDVPDLVDHMKQMQSSGQIDMDAYRGEPNLDDNVDKYGKAAKEDDLRGDGT